MKEIENENTFWEKLAKFIVDKRNAFFLLFIVLSIFCIFSSQWVQVNNNLIDYLPESTETRQGIDLMEDEFITYATGKIMVSNINLKEAERIAEDLGKIQGVSSVSFENNEDHFHAASALYEVSFAGEVEDEVSIRAMEEIRENLSAYDLYIDSEVGASIADILDQEMTLVIIVSIAIIVSVLIFTSKTYFEIDRKSVV